MSAQSFFPKIVHAHQRIHQLVARLEIESEPAEAGRLVRELLGLLAPHMVAEEEILFPAIQARVEEEEDRVMLLECYLDHEEVWDHAMRLQEHKPASDEAKATVRLINKILESHLEEEEGEILFMARRVLTYPEFSALARAVQDRQEELLQTVRRRLAGNDGAIGDLYRDLGDRDKRAAGMQTAR